jgi:hypothetical protein
VFLLLTPLCSTQDILIYFQGIFIPLVQEPVEAQQGEVEPVSTTEDSGQETTVQTPVVEIQEQANYVAPENNEIVESPQVDIPAVVESAAVQEAPAIVESKDESVIPADSAPVPTPALEGTEPAIASLEEKVADVAVSDEASMDPGAISEQSQQAVDVEAELFTPPVDQEPMAEESCEIEAPASLAKDGDALEQVEPELDVEAAVEPEAPIIPVDQESAIQEIHEPESSACRAEDGDARVPAEVAVVVEPVSEATTEPPIKAEVFNSPVVQEPVIDDGPETESIAQSPEEQVVRDEGNVADGSILERVTEAPVTPEVLTKPVDRELMVDEAPELESPATAIKEAEDAPLPTEPEESESILDEGACRFSLCQRLNRICLSRCY